MVEIIIDVRPKVTVLSSAYTSVPFDIGKAELEAQGFPIIPGEENAVLRIQEGKDSFVSQNGNWLREDGIYVPGKGAVLTKNPPIMKNPREATEAHRNGKEFYPTDEQIEKALADCVKLEDGNIPTNRFKDDERTVYLFGKHAEAYGDFLKDAKVTEMPVILAEMQDKAFARKAWFAKLGSGHSALGCNRDLSYDKWVRGVRRVDAEGIAQNFLPAQLEETRAVMPYTEEQLTRYSQIARGVRAGERPNSDLEEIADFFEGLKSHK